MAIAETSLPAIEVLAAGTGKYHPVDPDAHRIWVRDHKTRALTSKLMSEKDAVTQFVADGDYLVYECNYLTRGPNAILHEVIRQRRTDLWIGGKFTYVDIGLLVGAGCASKVDCGFFIAAPVIQQAIKEGRLEVFEYSNVVMTLRLQAGAMGLPFLPVRSFGGTDGFDHSGAQLIRDPYTGKPITIVPALNPDVAIIHAQQADIYGNARVFGTGISDVESAMAARKVIVSAEEIVSTDEIRRAPGLTSIPYYAVDAVVWAPYSSYPGTTPGYHASDPPAVMEVFGAVLRGGTDAYLEKWVYGMTDHSEMLEKRVGTKKLLDLARGEVIREGFRP